MTGHPDYQSKEPDDKEDPFGQYAHDTHAPKHSGKFGHYCCEFDGLWICEDCSEFQCCLCFPKDELIGAPCQKK